MARLIDADALLAEFAKLRNTFHSDEDYQDAIMIINFTPTLRGDNPSPPWIPVTERLPDDNVPVIGYDAFSESVLECCYSGNNWYLMDEHETELSNVTHWMELPNPPTE